MQIWESILIPTGPETSLSPWLMQTTSTWMLFWLCSIYLLMRDTERIDVKYAGGKHAIHGKYDMKDWFRQYLHAFPFIENIFFT